MSAGHLSEDEDMGGVRLKSDIDLDDLRDGKGVEFSIDEESVNNVPDETSSYFEQADVYKNSEIYNLGNDSNSDDEQDADMSDFDKLRKKMKPITDDKGIMKRVLRTGMGASIQEFIETMKAKEEAKPEEERRKFEEDDIQMAYHYSALQEGDMEPFDVTYLRDDRPQKAYLNNEFFPGFKVALASMKEKEVADFLIEPNYAFGSIGCAPRIQPNATLRYKIEMVKYWPTTELDSYAKMSREEKRTVPVVKLVKLCSKQREEANKLYQSAEFKGANHLYGKAIRILEDANLQNDEDEQLQSRALVKLYLNRAMCALKLERWDNAITFSNQALRLDPKNAKALYRKAKGKMEYGDYVVAKEIARRAHSEHPNDQGIGRLLSDIASREQKAKQRDRTMCQRMFGQNTPERTGTTLRSKELLNKFKQEAQQFKDSELSEMKVDATTYTASEMEALAAAAADLNLGVYPNKERGDWHSLRLKKET